MERIKLIRKLTVPAVVIFVISVLVLSAQVPYRTHRYKQHEAEMKAHIEELTGAYQQFLMRTAGEITSLPVDQKIVGKLQSRVLLDAQQVKLYFWMMDEKNEFVFGCPAAPFAKLNKAFDRYADVIGNDGYYFDRNDFLAHLIHQFNKINFSEFESRSTYNNQNFKWRFYDDQETGYYYSRPFRFVLSTPVTNQTGALIGNLYLKIDDAGNHKLYYNKRKIQRSDLFSTLDPIFGVIVFFSGLFLWFLLPTWVYIDAQQRDVKSPGLWAFLTMISLFFGLTIYLITRPSTYKAFYCPQCENELNGTKAFCPHCGFDLSRTFCPQCQYPIKPDWQFCPNCRAELKESKKMETEDEPQSEA
ncbi:MAG TPA: zinc ribbon domain-containing protein [Bacteroidetes bacterium]|nr:zinc ribbon domain-containing protein [Bacteroidota bacterium]